MRILDMIYKKKRDNDKNIPEVKFDQVVLELEKEIPTKCSIQINWSQSFDEAPKMYDCSFDVAMHGLDLYALELKNDIIPDESSLLFYNSEIKTENGKITSNKNCITCCQGISLNEGFNSKTLNPQRDY